MVCPFKGPHVAENVKSLEAASKRCCSSGLICILFDVFTQSLWPNAFILQSKIFHCSKGPSILGGGGVKNRENLPTSLMDGP